MHGERKGVVLDLRAVDAGNSYFKLLLGSFQDRPKFVGDLKSERARGERERREACVVERSGKLRWIK